MKSFLLKLVLIVFCMYGSKANAQTFQAGDIALNFNYGWPQVTPAVMKLLLKGYYNSRWGSNDYKIDITNSGVLNGKAEYGMNNELSLGLAASYWNMEINMQHKYNVEHPITKLKQDFTDYFRFNLSALALGVRGNYHFKGNRKFTVFDPYSGVSIGVTRYTFNAAFNSDYPDKLIPNDTWKYKSGWGTYFSSTIGVRIYASKFTALNLEAGWDRGAFLFGGVVFKIHTPALAMFVD